MATFIPSNAQKNFFNWIETKTGSCLLDSVAGSGKTTTVIEGLSRMKGDIFLGCYNKDIAVEIKSKLFAKSIRNVNAATFHSAGLAAWKPLANKFLKVDGFKCREIFKKLYDYNSNEYMAATLNLVSLAKQAAFDVELPATEEDWYELIDHFNVDCCEKEEMVISMAKQVLSESIKADFNIVDFDDMIYAPLIHNVKIPKYDWVLVDEAQDTNKARRILALRMMNPTSRLVAVGDPRQAIYGFTGADADSMQLLGDAVNAISLPLTTTFRCPKAVVKYAQTFVSHFEAAETAPEGSVTHLPEETDLTTIAKAGDAIMPTRRS